MLDALTPFGIEVPQLYDEGFSHNNCGGFCVRAGIGAFVNLYRFNPLLFQYHKEKEQEARQLIGEDVAILFRSIKGSPRRPYTLAELEEDLVAQGLTEEETQDMGGCGCFVS